MRIALIADIHANHIALEAVLADLAGEGIDQIICLGDIAATGPQPRQVIERLQQLASPAILGNADAELIGQEPYPTGAAARFGNMDRWCAAQLSPGHLDYLRALPATLTVPLEGKTQLVCCHGSPRSYNDVILATTPDAELAKLLGNVEGDLLVGGHTHFQMVRRFGLWTLLNPGSVGLAYDRTQGAGDIRLAPWAEYAIVTHTNNRQSLDLRRTSYDVSAFRAALLASGMPHAAWWAEKMG